MDHSIDRNCRPIEECTVFYFLGPEDIDRLVPFLEERRLTKGEILFTEGDPGNFMAFIRCGKLEVKKEIQFADKQILIAVLNAGSFVGEMAPIDGMNRAATVTALDDSDLYLLSNENLEAFLDAHPKAGAKIMRGIARVISVRLRGATERLTALF